MKDIVIIGSGGFANEVAFLIEEINRQDPQWNIIGFVDNHNSESKLRYPIVLNDTEVTQRTTPLHVAFGIGDPSLIEKLYRKYATNTQLKFPNLIHPNVIGDWERINLGIGNIICASNTLTTDIEIGDCNVLNLDCTIGHDVKIGSFNVINPSVNVSGNVALGNTNLIGTGATILQQLKITSNVRIGAQALINKNIEQSGTYVGVPAKQIS